MRQTHCVFEEKTAEASRSGKWSDQLLAHIAGCHACEEVALVASYLCEASHAARLGAGLPDAGRIWWKARVAANVEAVERALRPIVWARRFAFGLCSTVLVTAVVAWRSSLGGLLRNFGASWTHRRAVASAGHDNFLFFATAVFLLVLLPLIFGLCSTWSED